LENATGKTLLLSRIKMIRASVEIIINQYNMKTFQKLLLIMILTGLLANCGTTTQLRKSWSDPSLANNPVKPFEKVLVIVKARNDMYKKPAEDKLVTRIKYGNAIPSYTYLTPADTAQKELVEKLIKDGFDGVIMMRVKAVVQTETVNPGTSYSTWYGYSTPYGYSSGVSYELGSYERNATSNVDVNSAKDYIIETNIYSLESKMLLWSGVTASMSAKKIDPAITGIVNTIRKELQKKGFIKN
jgi:hypothetical protein